MFEWIISKFKLTKTDYERGYDYMMNEYKKGKREYEDLCQEVDNNCQNPTNDFNCGTTDALFDIYQLLKYK